MSDPKLEPKNPADALVTAITAKMHAHLPILARAPYGQISWRRTGDKLEIWLQPKL